MPCRNKSTTAQRAHRIEVYGQRNTVGDAPFGRANSLISRRHGRFGLGRDLGDDGRVSLLFTHRLSSGVWSPNTEGHSCAPEVVVAAEGTEGRGGGGALFSPPGRYWRGGSTLMSTSNKAAFSWKRASQSEGQRHGAIESTVL